MKILETSTRDQEQEVDVTLKNIDIYFNKQIDTLTIIDNITLTDNNNNIVPIKIAFNTQNNLDHKVSIILSAGTFIMGSPTSELGRFNNEVQHEVTLNSFYMSKYEITEAQFAMFKIAKGIQTDYQDSNIPVDVTFNQASELAAYIGGALPTEEQWEYACRAGTSTAFNTGNCLDVTHANFDMNQPSFYEYNCKLTEHSLDSRVPVGSYKPNYFGLYDMHGNVEEFCNSFLDVGSEARVVRGGTYQQSALLLRSACRFSTTYSASFRIVVNP